MAAAAWLQALERRFDPDGVFASAIPLRRDTCRCSNALPLQFA